MNGEEWLIIRCWNDISWDIPWYTPSEPNVSWKKIHLEIFNGIIIYQRGFCMAIFERYSPALMAILLCPIDDEQYVEWSTSYFLKKKNIWVCEKKTYGCEQFEKKHGDNGWVLSFGWNMCSSCLWSGILFVQVIEHPDPVGFRTFIFPMKWTDDVKCGQRLPQFWDKGIWVSALLWEFSWWISARP